MVQKTALILRCLAFSALVLALARTVHLTGGEGLSILVLRDLSASVPRLVSDQFIEQTSNQLGTLEFPDQVSLVSFGKDQQLEQPMSMRLGSGISADIDRSGSDIAAALRYSASLLEGSAPGGSRRVVLISDGNSTEGDAVREAKNLAVAGIVVDVAVASVASFSPVPSRRFRDSDVSSSTAVAELSVSIPRGFLRMSGCCPSGLRAIRSICAVPKRAR